MNLHKYHNIDLSKYSFLVTGGAGFIGSNIVEYLLFHNAKKIRVLDNLSTGHKSNIENYFKYENFEFIEGDIRSLETCKSSLVDIDYVFHEAALGSVPRSLNDPITSNEVNVSGFLNMLWAIKENKGVKRIVYAASSSTYGDHPTLPKVEEIIGKPLSPYAVTKYVNELYAEVFARSYNIQTIGLRYFNVFGKRQDPEGAYAAVIPKFVSQLINMESPIVNGDGSTSRDFTYVENIIQINMLAMFSENPESINQIYNSACGNNINLKQLLEILKKNLSIKNQNISKVEVCFGPSRKGDVLHSLASIEKATKLLGYEPLYSVEEGLEEVVNWYWENK